jgi:hypothetical protein
LNPTTNADRRRLLDHAEVLHRDLLAGLPADTANSLTKKQSC